MEFVYVSFNLKSFSNGIDSFDLIDKDYKMVYAPLIKFLFSHPNFKFSFSFYGSEISYFKKRRNELISICKSMLERNQIEILGGGFYNPILPLLFPVDRNGQIDMLSSEIRQSFQKRPRGASLFADSWDSSLVSSFATGGIEYVLLDSSLIPENKLKYLPLIMADFGKSIEIFPTYSNFTPNKDTEIEDFVQNIVKNAEKMDKKDDYFQSSPDRIINISFSHKEISLLLENKWFEKLSTYLEKNPDCKLKLINPLEFKKSHEIKVPCFIKCGINKKVAFWSENPYKKINSTQVFGKSIHNFLSVYPNSNNLYNRMLYLQMMINQYKGDKMRKKSAREKLWQAQNGVGFLGSLDLNAFSNSKFRQKCYKYLMEAEKILREDSFKSSVLNFDYNYDGFNEYVCRMENYFAYISLFGGSINELEVLKNTGNYADNLKRIKEFDGADDDYNRGIFVDHLFTQNQFENYINELPCGDGIFSRVRYSELKFSRHHNEVQLDASAFFGPQKQKIYLRKKYTINPNGMNVQYIIKNESDKPLKAKFAVESNFANTNYNSDNEKYFGIEVVDSDFVRIVDSKKSTKEFYKKDKLTNVDIVRLSDSENGISFAFEPNENCGYYFAPLIFKRPTLDEKSLISVAMTFVSTLYWDINIEAGMETEKNINFAISNIKKERKSTK